jgi:hypothetical protein
LSRAEGGPVSGAGTVFQPSRVCSAASAVSGDDVHVPDLGHVFPEIPQPATPVDCTAPGIPGKGEHYESRPCRGFGMGGKVVPGAKGNFVLTTSSEPCGQGRAGVNRHDINPPDPFAARWPSVGVPAPTPSLSFICSFRNAVVQRRMASCAKAPFHGFVRDVILCEGL